MQQPEIILIRVAGDDKPGLTAAITAELAKFGADILDIGQSVIHDSLTLGILVRVPTSAESTPFLKDLLFCAHKLGVNLSFTPVDPAHYESWVEAQGKPRRIVTLLARSLNAEHIAAVTGVIARNGLNIDIVNRLSGRTSLDGKNAPRMACVEFSVRGTPTDLTAMKSEFLAISGDMGVDIAIQEDNAFRRNRRLVAFDMDSTLIAAEVIDELAKAAGVGEQVSAITESAMRGEIDFQESLRRRLRQLKGLPEATLAEVAARIPLNDGAERLITNLKRFGYKIAIISGGFTYFGNRLKERLGIDYVFANELEIENGTLTGGVVGEIVDADKKAELLRLIADKEGLSLEQVIAVGDGANDLPMLGIAGLGIAYHAKPVVKKGAGHSISTLGLDSILYLVGVRDRDTLS